MLFQKLAITAAALSLAGLLSGCAGSPVALASMEDLSSASTIDLCNAAVFAPENSPERRRLLGEVRERGEISERELTSALQGEAYVGMSQTGALCAWGRPWDINRTVTRFGSTEQWVYVAGQYNIPSSFLYFEGDRLTTIQN